MALLGRTSLTLCQSGKLAALISANLLDSPALSCSFSSCGFSPLQFLFVIQTLMHKTWQLEVPGAARITGEKPRIPKFLSLPSSLSSESLFNFYKIFVMLGFFFK